MGFWESLLRRPQPTAFFTPNVTYLGGEDVHGLLLDGLTPAQMWATQPHLRTVVAFLARNIAQLGLQSFLRDGEDRKRDRLSAFARTMRRPNQDQTAYDLVFATVGDMALYDRAYWLTVPDVDSPSGWLFRRIPPPWVTPIHRDVFGAKAYAVLSPEGQSVDVSADQMLAFTGYHPSSPRKGSPTVEALKGVLQEQIEASKYRSQVWKRGGRVSAVLERPKDAPKWSPEAMKQFREDWYAKYTGDGPKAGGTPILEDGMTLNRVDFNAQEQQYVEAAKLSFSTVASAFHVNPTMIGILDNANFSNVREFRRMLYGDTLGPTVAQIEDRINTFLLPRMGMDNGDYYAEFNIAEKLQGSFEEQAAVMSTLVGRPIMTANEGRSKFNLPALTGDADALATPLNVLIGGQASPRDSGSQNVGTASRGVKSVEAKSRPPQTFTTKAEQVLSAFFTRQAKVVKSRLGAKADADWWDTERWDTELAADLYRLAVLVSSKVAADTLEAIGFSPDEYDTERTVAFLTAVTARVAGGINAVTKTQVDEALTDDDPMESVGRVFEVAETSRSAQAGLSAVTLLAGFATVEATKQVAGDQATKTWVTTSQNPRSSHARMDGETVGIDEEFSNGAKFPGDGALDIDDTAGCRCDVQVNIP